MTRKMPARTPFVSVQSYGTDPRFLAAFRRQYGEIVWDLAAHAGNTVCGDRYFGPGSRWGEDSLERAWDRLPGVPRQGWRWLNFEYSYPKIWMPKVAREARYDINIAVLGLASVGSGWFRDLVEPFAFVRPLSPRLIFEGMPPNPKTGKVDPFPADLMLMLYGPDIVPGFKTWRWNAPAGVEVAA